MPSARDIERFWAHVKKTETCWLWRGTVNANGYGRFHYASRLYLAHRVAYEMLVRPIPAGLTIDHLCRVRNCVNPDHMEVVTGAENTRRRHRMVTHCPLGHAYEGHNVFLNKNGSRICRACKVIEQRRRRLRKAAELRQEIFS